MHASGSFRLWSVAEYLDDLKQYGPTYVLWSGSEEELVEPLKGVASCIDKCCQATEEQLSRMSDSLVPLLHEYVLCSDAIKVLMEALLTCTHKIKMLSLSFIQVLHCYKLHCNAPFLHIASYCLLRHIHT